MFVQSFIYFFLLFLCNDWQAFWVFLGEEATRLTVHSYLLIASSIFAQEQEGKKGDFWNISLCAHASNTMLFG